MYFLFKEMCKPDCPTPKELSDTGGLSSYLWKIENKYYTADVHLCACSVSSLPPQCEFASNINFQSVIITFDQKEVSLNHCSDSVVHVDAQTSLSSMEALKDQVHDLLN